MVENIAEDPRQVLTQSKIILLIDWPNPEVPGTLLHAGFKVFCHSPNGYTKPYIVAEYPHRVNQKNRVPLKNEQEGYLVFKPLDKAPAHVDIVNIFRPEQEHRKIISDHVIPLGAKCIWLQPPVTSANTPDVAYENSLTFIEGHDIAELARQLNDRK
ncbi:MAG TPA: CoA-binding protein [Chitinophagaceae bacterium]|nr:CoA-binding protein [Chitinophagaceae bacterium]